MASMEEKEKKNQFMYLLLFLADFAAFHPIVVGAVFLEEILGGFKLVKRTMTDPVSTYKMGREQHCISG